MLLPVLVTTTTVLFFAIIFLIVTLSTFLSAQLNAKEEAICSTFLTSTSSSPLLEHIQRNIKYDEDSEFSCELVLQDRYLPLQIRLTIHEGLHYLQLRHIALGVDKYHEALRHCVILTEILPNSFRFHYFTSTNYLLMNINQPKQAYQHLYACIYGQAKDDEDPLVTVDMRYQAHIDFVKVLTLLQCEEEANYEIKKILYLYPFDYRMMFLYDELNRMTRSNSDSSSDGDSAASSVSSNTMSIYANMLSDLIRSVAKTSPAVFDQYQGFLSSYTKEEEESVTTWSPKKFTSLPSAEEVEGHLLRREPFIISLGSTERLDKQFHWKTSQWVNNNEYWKSKVPDTINVEIEGIPTKLLQGCNASPITATESDIDDNASSEGSGAICGQYGTSLHQLRRYSNFHDILDWKFQDLNYSYYLNLQRSDGNSKSPYRLPLNYVQEDISPKHTSFFNEIMKNITNIHLWMGNTIEENHITTSRLHRDATDNLYFLLQGKKQFTIWSPSHGYDLNTISPTYGMNEDGLSHQFNINSFRDFINNQLKVVNHTLEDVFVEHNADSKTKQYYYLIKQLLAKEVIYNIEDNHFSTLTTNPKSTSSQQQCSISLDEGVDSVNDKMHCEAASSELPRPDAVINMEAGDILFLPTGWFHQVKSFSGKHMAMNYWWKPINWSKAVESEKMMTTALHEALWNVMTEKLEVE